MYSKKNLYTPEYPIKLDEPRAMYMEDPITHARTYRGVRGWELWGRESGGGESRLDTLYSFESREILAEWQAEINLIESGDLTVGEAHEMAV